jgi:2-amino-4-hydroxy-6-hydroxymethyldihydropteridine diphosphokinase
MPRVWISIGSNVEPERHVRAALAELRAAFGDIIVSPLYQTEAVGFAGDDFLNLVVGLDTELAPARLHRLMHEIEQRHGRERGGERFAARTLDLDVLTYGDAVTREGGKALPRDEILRYAFVLGPLADVAGDELHPVQGERYRDLWARFPAPDKVGLRRLGTPGWLDRGPD